MQQQGYHNGAERQGHFAARLGPGTSRRSAVDGAGLVIIPHPIERLGIAQTINAVCGC